MEKYYSWTDMELPNKSYPKGKIQDQIAYETRPYLPNDYFTYTIKTGHFKGDFDFLKVKDVIKRLVAKDLDNYFNVNRFIDKKEIYAKVLEIDQSFIVAKCLIHEGPEGNIFEKRKFDVSPIKHLKLNSNDILKIEIITSEGERKFVFTLENDEPIIEKFKVETYKSSLNFQHKLFKPISGGDAGDF